MKKSLLIFFALVLALPAWAEVPERRKDQFSTEEGWYIIPAPFSVPGLGSGLIIAGLWNNIEGSYTDVGISSITGDFEGQFAGLMDWHLIEKNLVADFGGGKLNRATVSSYQGRGFDSDPDDVFTYTVVDGDGVFGRLTLTFWERRLNAYVTRLSQSSRLEGVYGSDGELIFKPESAPKNEVGLQMAGLILDFTDNWYDPRSGLRFGQNYSSTIGLDEDKISPEQYTLDLNATAFVPVGLQSTWVFNVFDSRAVVTKKGLTNRTLLRQELFGNLDCALTPDPVGCEKAVNLQLNDVVAANKYGTASGLGGVSRLRAFPMGRFKGAQTQFYGTEFRWNMTDEISPFNWYLVKDVRTSLQMAFFYELGSIADTREELGKEWRTSKGVGFRMVTSSGLVFRIEVAHGEEGFNQLMFFDYPWTDGGF